MMQHTGRRIPRLRFRGTINRNSRARERKAATSVSVRSRLLRFDTASMCQRHRAMCDVIPLSHATAKIATNSHPPDLTISRGNLNTITIARSRAAAIFWQKSYSAGDSTWREASSETSNQRLVWLAGGVWLNQTPRRKKNKCLPGIYLAKISNIGANADNAPLKKRYR